jgi:MoaD family protein
MPAVSVNVNYYHRVRELCGRTSERLHLEEGATIHDLLQKLFCSYPSILPLRNSLLIARNHEYAQDSEPLAENDVVEVMQPVSGG